MPEDTAPQLTEFEVLVEDLILTAVHKVFDASGIDDDVLATVEANADLALDLTGEILQQLIGGAYLAKPFDRGGVFPLLSPKPYQFGYGLDVTPPKPIFQPTQPTVGRIVHYTDDESRPPLAAIITAVDDYTDEGRVFLHLFDPSGTRLCELSRIPFSQTPKAFHWSWPPRT
ncbi:hypothetical protein C1M55_28215 [Rhodococcus qingshengii]|uniref:hypothetical protein n=1 Tax=Rhodococcus qingshengii TaxID=334542 RepID=UPI000C9F5331|nr:hypothetical protein [Rhodococcus qingshengii]AUS34617.1 hypothetical protein C1M55_28215 [Rhodococcus qingshengii]